MSDLLLFSALMAPIAALAVLRFAQARSDRRTSRNHHDRGGPA